MAIYQRSVDGPWTQFNTVKNSIFQREDMPREKRIGKEREPSGLSSLHPINIQNSLVPDYKAWHFFSQQ